MYEILYKYDIGCPVHWVAYTGEHFPPQHPVHYQHCQNNVAAQCSCRSQRQEGEV